MFFYKYLAYETFDPRLYMTPFSLTFFYDIAEDVTSASLEQSKSQLLLSTSSANERRAWLRAIRKQLYIDKGGGKLLLNSQFDSWHLPIMSH